MTTHTELLNYIAAKIGAKSYLEIGTNNCKNFNAIQVAHKVGVDPDLASPCAIHKTSDQFFKEIIRVGQFVSETEIKQGVQSTETFDLIFIDGLHHAEQVHMDIMHSWYCLSEKGVIVIHDCNPSEEKYTHVPRDSKIWNGDVYRDVCQIESKKFTIDIDYGCCIIRKRDEIKYDTISPYCNWEMFVESRKELLNLVSLEEGLKLFDEWI